MEDDPNIYVTINKYKEIVGKEVDIEEETQYVLMTYDSNIEGKKPSKRLFVTFQDIKEPYKLFLQDKAVNLEYLAKRLKKGWVIKETNPPELEEKINTYFDNTPKKTDKLPYVFKKKKDFYAYISQYVEITKTDFDTVITRIHMHGTKRTNGYSLDELTYKKTGFRVEINDNDVNITWDKIIASSESRKILRNLKLKEREMRSVWDKILKVTNTLPSSQSFLIHKSKLLGIIEEVHKNFRKEE